MPVLDAAWRLGARPVALYALARLARSVGLTNRALRSCPPATGALLPSRAPPAPELPDARSAALAARAAALSVPPGWHAPFPSEPHALDLDLFGPGDIRPVWERSRLAEIVLLVQAARLDPGGPHLARAEAWLEDWAVRNPAFHGPNWACGQEAALRVLHLALALALLEADHAPPPGARALLGQHARRIAATPAYALAQDNNHPVSEAAGLFACGLLLGDGTLVRTGAERLVRAVRRLVAPCGAFAQPSTGYQRLLLDTLSVAEWLRRRHGAPGFGEEVLSRIGAATEWLFRLTDPATGAVPRLGHLDGSALADLSLAGPEDARPSLERAARLFDGRSAGFAPDPGCTWLGLTARPGHAFARPAAWRSEGWAGWEADGARAVLRTGVPLRFRPGHADLLHFDLWDGARNLLRDGGTGAYNPPPAQAWWLEHFPSAAAHNTIVFDGREPMLRLSRFLFAGWPETWSLEDGAGRRDRFGITHERRVHVEGRVWTVEDRVTGPFRRAVLRWRLAPGAWRSIPTGVTGPFGEISVTADVPVERFLRQGWESLAYGQVTPAPVLEVHAPATRFLTIVRLP